MSWTSVLTAIAAACGSAAPLSAQIGLASSPGVVHLTAVRHGSVSVALPPARATMHSDPAGEPGDAVPGPVATSWRADVGPTASVALAAYLDPPASAHGGTQRAAARAGSAPVLLSRLPASGTAVGGRTDELEVRIDLTTLPGLSPGTDAGTLNLVAVTQ